MLRQLVLSFLGVINIGNNLNISDFSYYSSYKFSMYTNVYVFYSTCTLNILIIHCFLLNFVDGIYGIDVNQLSR